MAGLQVHITDESSGTDFLTFDGPGTLLMDADAFLITNNSALVLLEGGWTATINGKLTSTGSGVSDAAIQLPDLGSFKSSIIVGVTGEVTGLKFGVFALHATSVTNKGLILAEAGYGIAEAGGDYTINNSGTIFAGLNAIDLTGGGTHTIINSGSIEATGLVVKGSDAVDKVTNSGVFTGDVELRDGNDVFTDFAKVKVKHKLVTHHGFVSGTIDLGAGDDHFTGGNNAETVQDNSGADTYKLGGGNDTYRGEIGGSGVNTVDGGTGSDTFIFSGSGGETGGPGYAVNLDKIAHGGIGAGTATNNGVTDTIVNFENVFGSTHDDIVYGNAAANNFSGGEGDDTLFGLAGNDVLNGDGNDDFLYGGDGNDVLDGGFGSDHLYGGAGRDIMTGHDNLDSQGNGEGSAADTFHFLSVSDSGVTANTRDVITDFNALGGHFDIIDLSEIDAIKGTAANDDFTFIGQSKWHHIAGELRYVSTQTQTIVEADVNGDAKVDFSVALDGHHALTAADFVL